MCLPSCHPERRAKPAVEPVGRCVASGSTRGKDDILARDPAPQFDFAYATLRMTRRDFALQENMSLFKAVLVRKIDKA